MLRNIIKDTSSSSEDSYMFFENNYENFKPIKKLVTFFDSENFLITSYAVEGIFVHMVLENWKGQEIHINNMNCGYNGAGPRFTEKLLKFLGMDSDKAAKLILYDGLQIGFTKDGKINEADIEKEVFFGGNVRQNKYSFDINKYMHIVLNEKKIYMLNPHLVNFSGFIELIKKMKVRELEYFIGKDSPLEESFRYENKFKLFELNKIENYKKIKGAKEVNFIIRGERFDIICLIKKSDLMMVINIVYLYLFNENLFENTILGNYSILTIEKQNSLRHVIFNFFKTIFKCKSKNVHESIRIKNTDKGIEKWKIQF